MRKADFKSQDIRKQINLKIPKDVADQLAEFLDRRPYSKFSGIIIEALRMYLSIELANPQPKVGIIDEKKTEYREDIMPDGSYGPDHNPDPSKSEFF